MQVQGASQGSQTAKPSAGRQRGEGTSGAAMPEPDLVEVPAGTRWQDVVIDLIGERTGGEASVDWTRRHRRSAGNVYMPRKRRQQGIRLALVVDVSGSCVEWFGLWSKLAAELVEELRDVVEMDIIYHDVQITDMNSWHRSSGEEPAISSHGGGGTCHKEVLAYVNMLDVDAVVMFTDSDSVWPVDLPTVPCITVQPPGSYDVTPFGKTIRAGG